ncbi:MAG: sialidase family protein [Planctomycetota bacterium]|jgi:Neuraminidase (sialidase)
MMVYSADKEGKGGAIVSRTSTDYGETWSESKNVTDNQHRFGLAVAPNSLMVATNNNDKITLHGYKWSDSREGY